MKTINKLGYTFTSTLVLMLLCVSVMSCKSDAVTTTTTITEKNTVTSTVVSNVTSTLTNTETITSTVISTWTPTQTSTSQTTPTTSQTTPTTTKTTSTTPTTSTTMTYTTGTTSVAWSADGIISEGEYAQMQQMDSNYYAYWNADDEYVYVGIKVKTEGWIAWGANFNVVGSGEYINDSDVVFGHFVNGEPVVFDGYAISSTTMASDVQLKKTDDIAEWGMTRTDGYTTMEFKRLLDTGDTIHDCALNVGGANYIVWGYGSTDKISIWRGGMINLKL